jgi:diphthamide synthase subunit DPH2
MDEQQWRVQDTVDYVCSRNFRIVTLQFPDEYLKHAAGVCKAITAACEARGHAVKVRPLFFVVRALHVVPKQPAIVSKRHA